MNAAERAPYFDAGDAVLGPLGFKRKKKEYEWRRTMGSDVEWIHLNFGLAVINPSYGVSYTDLNELLPAELRVRCYATSMLRSLTGTSYSSPETTPSEIARDLLRALPELTRFRDRRIFTEILMSETSSHGMVILFSDRIRMLPLLLVSAGRVQEAFDWIARFEALAPTRDHMAPGYEVFASHFRAKYETRKA
jgi:hypothetical protein